ncbi:MAG TPA: cation diffusion facilitator family transporter [Puia sp.]|nr:cation diffusion facilitator family transporter [Puia sp.]
MEHSKENLKVQQWVVIVAIILFIIKVVAYYLTHSVAILTDTLESTVNVIAGFIGLYSLYVAAKPRDEDHPYGHGKAEFLSAAVEGALITMAGLIIIYEAVENFIYPQQIKKLDFGILLIAITGVINFIVGYISVAKGKKNNSLALIASGRHLQSDTYSTIGIIVALGLIYFTQLRWMDSAVSIVLAFVIIYTGYRILRASIAGIMDETDEKLLQKLVTYLNNNRRENWIDVHNLRVIKYGGLLHVDCHVTVPWYLNVREAHYEIDTFSKLIRKEFGETLELFVHSDACLDFSCSICTKTDCDVRKKPFEKKIEWTLKNIQPNKKHDINTSS